MKRDKTWKLKTSPELFEPVLRAKHKKASTDVAIAFHQIDQLYKRVQAILDKHGIIHAQRGLYRSYAEQLWKLSKKYNGKTFQAEAYALGVKYFLYGCNLNILREISVLVGFTQFNGLVLLMTDVVKEQLKQALEEASTLRSPKVVQNPLETDFEYDELGRLSKITIKDLVTGKVKIKQFEYDKLGNLIRIYEVKQ